MSENQSLQSELVGMPVPHLTVPSEHQLLCQLYVLVRHLEDLASNGHLGAARILRRQTLSELSPEE